MNFNTEWLAAHSANLLGEITGESFHFVSEGKALHLSLSLSPYIYNFELHYNNYIQTKCQ